MKPMNVLLCLAAVFGSAITQELDHATVSWEGKEIFIWPDPTDKKADGNERGIGKWSFKQKGNKGVIEIFTPFATDEGKATLNHKKHKLLGAKDRVTCFWAEDDMTGKKLIKQEPTKTIKPDEGGNIQVDATLLNTGPFVVIGYEHNSPSQQPMFVQIVTLNVETESIDGELNAIKVPTPPFVDTSYGRLVAGRIPDGLKVFLPPFKYPAITYKPRMDAPLSNDFVPRKNTKTFMFDSPAFQQPDPRYLANKIAKIENKRALKFTTFVLGLGEEQKGGRPSDVWGYWKWEISVTLTTTDPNQDKVVHFDDYSRTIAVSADDFVETEGAVNGLAANVKETVTSYAATVKDLLEHPVWKLKEGMVESVLNRFIGKGWRDLVK